MPSVVTCLLLDENNKLLILKRSNKVKTYQGKWSGVAGYVEKDERPSETALKEIKEEICLEEEDIKLIKRGTPVVFSDVYKEERYDWKVNPFVFKTSEKDKIKIDWEHTEYRWIPPSDIKKYDTVPQLKEIVSKLLL